MNSFKNLLEVTTYFADAKKAQDYLITLRWNGAITCAHCGHDKVYELKGENKRFKCAKCREHFSATKGTIFENSAIPLQKWFIAIYLITSHKKGISSHQLAKDISITQKSAWFVLHRVRFALQTGSFEANGDNIYEADETYVGGKEKNKHRSAFAQRQKADVKRENDKLGIKTKRVGGRNLGSKTAVAGIVQRDGNVTAKVVKNTGTTILTEFINQNVKKGATIVTDEWQSYDRLGIEYAHEVIRHRMGEYVNGEFHTNSIEGFWSHLKRGIYGIYHHVSPKHLDSYIDEFEYRYNTRKFTEIERFEKMLSKMCNRLTYAKLIANA